MVTSFPLYCRNLLEDIPAIVYNKTNAIFAAEIIRRILQKE